MIMYKSLHFNVININLNEIYSQLNESCMYVANLNVDISMPCKWQYGIYCYKGDSSEKKERYDEFTYHNIISQLTMECTCNDSNKYHSLPLRSL